MNRMDMDDAKLEGREMYKRMIAEIKRDWYEPYRDMLARYVWKSLDDEYKMRVAETMPEKYEALERSFGDV